MDSVTVPEMRKIKRSPSNNDMGDLQQNDGRTKFAKTTNTEPTFDSKVVLNEELYRNVREMFPRRAAKTIKRVLARYSYNEYFMNKICDRLLRNDPDGASDDENAVLVATPPAQPQPTPTPNIIVQPPASTSSNSNIQQNTAASSNTIAQQSIPTTSSNSNAATTSEKPAELTENEKLNQDISEVIDFVPDCDYDFIAQQLMSLREQPQRVQILIQDLVYNKKYPKIKDSQQKKRHLDKLNNYLDMPLDIEELLKVVSDPFGYYGDLKRDVSDSYKRNCRVYLENTFNMLASNTIDKLMVKFNNHVTPIIDEIDFALKCNEQRLSRGDSSRSPGSKKGKN